MKISKLIFLFCACAILLGCHQSVSIDQGWMQPIKITESDDSLGGGVVLYKWQNRIIALKSQHDGLAKCFLMNSNDNSWTEVQFTGIPRGYLWYRPAANQNGDKILFEQSYTENDKLVVSILIGQLTINDGLAMRNVVEKKWIISAETLFEERRPDVRLTEQSEARDEQGFELGLIDNSNIDIPYSIEGFTFNGKNVNRGPYVNGILHSTNSGVTWRTDSIFKFQSRFQSWCPWICRTKGHLYYLEVKGIPDEKDQLWSSRASETSDSWDTPEAITKTFGGGEVMTAAQDDTIHLCWLDSRHEKHRFNLEYPNRDNFEVVYSSRKDSDVNWNKNVILSKGLLYSYSPSMSVEGNKIVVAWAGAQTAKDWHTNFDPNDIYYVASNDGGKTWTKPLRVTDNIKSGVTAGDPHVILLNGIIHLTYIQGKMNLKQEMAGLVKLNQPPWPIYYQQRPFPN